MEKWKFFALPGLGYTAVLGLKKNISVGAISGIENRESGRGYSLRWPRDTFYPQKLAITSPTSGGRSVGIVRFAD
jgi:hypothetical protein